MSSPKKMGRPATGTNPVQGLRMSTHRWRRLGEVAQLAGTDRSKLINDFAAWYTREPGAKRPTRPELESDRD